MNLDELKARKVEIEQALVNASNTLQVVAGHKAEIDHWIKLATDKVEAVVEEVVETEEQLPVE